MLAGWAHVVLVSGCVWLLCDLAGVGGEVVLVETHLPGCCWKCSLGVTGALSDRKLTEPVLDAWPVAHFDPVAIRQRT